MVGTGRNRVVGLAETLMARLQSRARPTGRRRTLLLIGAAVLFLGAMVLALRSLPEGELSINWPLVVVTAVLGAPALLAMNGVEYTMSARLLGQRVPGRDALTVAVYGGAANLLPIPGTALVRLQALTRQGSGVRRAAGATAVVAVAWFGAAGLVGAPAAALGGNWLLAVALAGGGIVAVPVVHRSIVTLQRRVAGNVAAPAADAGTGTASGECATAAAADPDPDSSEHHAPGAGRLTAELVGLEVVMILVRGLRFWLVILAFGLDASALTAFVLPVAGVLASALGFLPGGLGIRELLAGMLSGASGDGAAVGVLVSGLDRIIALPVLALISLSLAAWERGHPAEADPAEAPVDGAAQSRHGIGT